MLELTTLELTRDGQRLTILPDCGAALGQWQVRGHDMLRPVANPALRAQQGRAVGAYPLLPYVNRIAGGRFAFGGAVHQLAPNMAGCPHPLHGNGWQHGWELAHRSAAHAILTFDHIPAPDGAPDSAPDDAPDGEAGRGEWPYAFRAALSYELRADGLCVSLVLENRDRVDQPVGFGFHPFFPMESGSRLAFGAERVWLTDGQGLPVEARDCAGEWDFTQGQTLAEQAPAGQTLAGQTLAGQTLAGRALDNCFAGFGGQARLEQPGNSPAMTMEADGIFSHLVVFSRPEEGYVAIEPVTSMTDALNRPDIAGRGLHVLAPGQSCGGTIRFRAAAARRPAEG